MSEHSYYRAFPEASGLYQRLQRDRGFHVLYTHLTLLGPGPFFLSHLEPSDITDPLDWLAEHEPAIGSRAEADRLLDDLRREVGQAMARHPGIELRAAYLEQVQEELEGVLAGLFRRQGEPSAEDLPHALLYGKEPLAPGLLCDWELKLYLVPVGTVREGAAALQQMTAALLQDACGEWDPGIEDYELWRAFYREAAQRGEVVTVLTA